MKKLIVILGPTAVGKTNLAVQLAKQFDGEIISADSRQVYKRMDIGTGKDLAEFVVDGKIIPHHLIDIIEPGEAYNLFHFQQDFYSTYQLILEKSKTPILCGGSGLYLDMALNKNQLVEVGENKILRKELSSLNQQELIDRLETLNSKLHNTTDLYDRKRTLRAIEIETEKKNSKPIESPIGKSLVFGITMERKQLRERIKERLEARLNEGMVSEVESLLKEGVSHEALNYYGLEYRFISMYLQKELTYEEMFEKLLQAIRRFAKKQMTYFRRMEKNGIQINWMDANLSLQEKMNFINEKLNESL